MRKFFILLFLFVFMVLFGAPQSYNVVHKKNFLSTEQYPWFDMRVGKMGDSDAILIAEGKNIYLYYNRLEYSKTFSNKIVFPGHFSPTVDLNNDGETEILIYETNNNTGNFCLLDKELNVIAQSDFQFFDNYISHWEFFTYNNHKYIVPYIMSWDSPQIAVLDENLNIVWSKSGDEVPYGMVRFPYPMNCITDVNNDGIPDIVVSLSSPDYKYKICIFNGINGNTTLSNDEYSSNPYLIVDDNIRDLDGDGPKEMFFTLGNWGAEKFYVLNSDLSQRFVKDYSASNLSVEDFDLVKLGGGKYGFLLEIDKVENYESTLNKYVLCDNTGTDLWSVDFSSGDGDVGVIDMDNNGVDELILYKANENTISLYKNGNYGQCAWSYAVNTPICLNIADFNGGSKDLCFLDYNSVTTSITINILDGDTGTLIGTCTFAEEYNGEYDELLDKDDIGDEISEFLDLDGNGKIDTIALCFSDILNNNKDNRVFTFTFNNNSLSQRSIIEFDSTYKIEDVEVLYNPTSNSYEYYINTFKDSIYSLVYNYDLDGNLKHTFHPYDMEHLSTFDSFGLNFSNVACFLAVADDKRIYFLNENLDIINTYAIDDTNFGNLNCARRFFFDEEEKTASEFPDLNGDGYDDLVILTHPYGTADGARRLIVMNSDDQTTADAIGPVGRIYFGAYYVPVNSAIIGTDFQDENGVSAIYLKEYYYNKNNSSYALGYDYGWMGYRPTYSIALTDAEGAHIFHGWGKDSLRNVSGVSAYGVLNVCHPDYQINHEETIPYMVYIGPGETVQIKVEISSGDVDLFGWKPYNTTNNYDYHSTCSGTTTDSITIHVTSSDDAGYYCFEAYGYASSSIYTCTINKVDNVGTTLNASLKEEKTPYSVEKKLKYIKAHTSAELPAPNTPALDWMLFR